MFLQRFCKRFFSFLLQPLHRFLFIQKYLLTQYLDPLISQGGGALSQSFSSKWNVQLVFPPLSLLLATLYGNVFLPVYQAEVPFTWTGLSTSQALFYRQILPQELWPQTDLATAIGVFSALLILASFLVNPWNINRYWLNSEQTIVRIGKTVLNQDTSEKIIKYHRYIKGHSFAAFIVLVIFSTLFIYINLLFINAFYGFSVGFLICCLMQPLVILYMEYALFGITVFFILALCFIQIRQKDVLWQLQQVNCSLAKLQKRQISKPKPHRRKIISLKRQNVSLNRTVLDICVTIESYATFWCPILSFFFLNHMSVQTYLLYGVFFNSSISFIRKFLFLYIIFYLDLALFSLITLCARVVKLNRAIERSNRNFYLALFLSRSNSKSTRQVAPSLSCQLKAESLQTSGRLRAYAFRLFDNYRITSRTFYMVISNVSLFFMLVLKKFKYN